MTEVSSIPLDYGKFRFAVVDRFGNEHIGTVSHEGNNMRCEFKPESQVWADNMRMYYDGKLVHEVSTSLINAVIGDRITVDWPVFSLIKRMFKNEE